MVTELVFSILVSLLQCGFISARGGGGGGGGGGGASGGGNGSGGGGSAIGYGVFGGVIFLAIGFRFYQSRNKGYIVSECNKKCRLHETKPATLAAFDSTYAESWICDSCGKNFMNANDDLLLHCHSCKLDFCEECSRGRLQPNIMLDQTIRPNLSPQGTLLHTPSTFSMMGGGYAAIDSTSQQNQLCGQQMDVLTNVLASNNLRIVPHEEGQNVEHDDPNAHIEQSQLCPDNMKHVQGVLANNGLRIVPASTNSPSLQVTRVV